MTTKKKDPRRIPEDVLNEQWFSLLHSVLGNLQATFRRVGISQEEIGARIGMDPARVSKCLRGQQNMTLKTMHKLARGMDCRLEIALCDLKTLTPSNDRARTSFDSRPQYQPAQEAGSNSNYAIANV